MSVFAQLFVYQLNKKDLEVLLNLGESQAHCLADSRHNTSDQILLFSEFSHLHLQLHYLLIPVPLFSVCCNRSVRISLILTISVRISQICEH